MAKSPEKNASSSEVIRYDRGWNAINAMLRAGRSLSGHERNCCFLNTRGARFADVSSVAGVDFADDGRVLALSDWDFDGDVDFWIANRSGPQLRYLENRVAGKQNFVAIRLEGINCNRDAIGARVIVDCTLQGSKNTQTATLKAGEGYLAQNSKWLHFGLGENGTIQAITIRWPHGRVQKIEALEPNKFYSIREGETPTRWQPPTGQFAPLSPEQFDAPPVSDQARIVLLQPLPIPAIPSLPTLQLPGHPTEDKDSSKETTRPVTLINLWATWCQPCLQELAEWKQHANDFEKLGLGIVAINVDEPTPERKTRVHTVWSKLNPPFDLRIGDKPVVEQFDVMQRSLLSRQRPLPVPSSFLIDAEGRLCVLYKGPVTAKTLMKDAQLVGAQPQQILDAAIPFKGRWHTPPGGSTPLHLAVKYLEGGLLDEGAGYIESLLARRDTRPEYVTSSILNLYGATMLDRKEFRKAELAFRESLNLDATNRQAHIELGTILLRSKRGKLAIPHFEQAFRKNATDPEISFKLGMAHLEAGNFAEARQALRRSTELRPNPSALWQLAALELHTPTKESVALAIQYYEAAIGMNPQLALRANNLAWILATHPDSSVRDGKRALELAQKICATSNTDPTAVDTLAAAFAAAGDFTNAVSVSNRASELAQQAGKLELAKRIQRRTELYEQQKPYVENY